MNVPYFWLVNMINWWEFALTDYKRGVLGTGQARNRGLRHGLGSKKGCLRHGSWQKRGSLPKHIHVLDIYVSAPPPPPPGILAYHTGLDKHKDIVYRPTGLYAEHVLEIGIQCSLDTLADMFTRDTVFLGYISWHVHQGYSVPWIH